jgi:hypothetical protein
MAVPLRLRDDFKRWHGEIGSIKPCDDALERFEFGDGVAAQQGAITAIGVDVDDIATAIENCALGHPTAATVAPATKGRLRAKQKSSSWVNCLSATS